MEFRTLGRSGLRVSLTGLGCNNFGARLDLEASRKVIHAAIDQGITLFDTADVYGNRGGSETILGEVLGARRKDIVLASKFGIEMDDAGVRRGASRRYIMEAVEASLHRLKTDWIDLYQQHRYDATTPIEETLRALEDLIRQGKVRYIGCSNFSAWQMVDAHWSALSHGVSGFVSCQDEYSLLMRGHERDLIPAMRAKGLGLLPYFPLACGMLTGKYRRNAALPGGARITDTQRHQDKYFSDRNWTIVEKLDDYAQARGKALVDLAFAWLAAKEPVASVIAGATSPEQIAANVRATTWTLTATEVGEIDAIAAA
jgi:aryl-alcohol dehydrogenase-like predicted oxidoreductase